MKSAFANNMVKARLYFNWTQEKAAQRIGIRRSNLAAYEEGRAAPRLEVFPDICKAYQIPDMLNFICDDSYEMATRRAGKEVMVSVIDCAYDKAPDNIKNAINVLLEL
jgi:DNA-binding XRE family transcriptional regulator